MWLVALVDDGSSSRALFSWGRNHKGQLGRGFESTMEMKAAQIDFSKVTNFKIKRMKTSSAKKKALSSSNNYFIYQRYLAGRIIAWHYWQLRRRRERTQLFIVGVMNPEGSWGQVRIHSITWIFTVYRTSYLQW